MQTAICRGLDDSLEVQNFLSGIVLGLRHQTTEDIEEAFQQTGTLHLFAVAGLHVGIVAALLWMLAMVARLSRKWAAALRSEEHTSELQSHSNLVCRLLLEKKKKKINNKFII